MWTIAFVAMDGFWIKQHKPVPNIVYPTLYNGHYNPYKTLIGGVQVVRDPVLLCLQAR